jgi:hypothetical protein
MLEKAKVEAIENAFKKHSTPEERTLLRNAFCLVKITVKNSASEFVIVEDVNEGK